MLTVSLSGQALGTSDLSMPRAMEDGRAAGSVRPQSERSAGREGESERMVAELSVVTW